MRDTVPLAGTSSASPAAVARPWALLTDAPGEAPLIAAVEARSATGLVAVLVLPAHFEMARVLMPSCVRVVTHPWQLHSMGVHTCVAWDATEVLERYAGLLCAFATVVDSSDGLPRSRGHQGGSKAAGHGAREAPPLLRTARVAAAASR